MKRFFLFLSAILTSCRCYTDYQPLSEKSMPGMDTTIAATAQMSQGDYDHLSIDITIRRMDSLFVKNITVKPSLPDRKFYPWFEEFIMYSYYYETEGRFKGGPYWKDYWAKTFDELPTENRTTNKDSLFVKYTAFFNSSKAITFKNFSVDIEAVLADRSGQLITHKRHVELYGERECHCSVH